MSRLSQVAPEQANDKVRPLYDAVNKKLGMVPNMMKTMGHSAATLSAYLQFSGQLAGGVLTAKDRELIALAVGQSNECNYCLAAHSALGKHAGLSDEQIIDARRGSAVDSRDDALVQFAKAIVQKQGRVSDQDLSEVQSHGFQEDAITEIIAGVALNLLTNYFNHVADPVIDFPAAPELAVA
ncbi:carboxymuconolactone decarboxylase family protein [Roseiconus lacunae]|uniref:Carboxymuconolactone decarboxylase family protein n=1 Tax=Roseiconus lacunae TaxID=2605694 RepID=A0ABT7PRV3_9BACT|nr:carboxymuconolactone decarboxylase family protein [Roseiconus lacunae]MCD0463213.1 carboxymuconolactone decarboxylase family protein [Roseiconus lacunae]MDM4019073.1 carboxymuconolactone decarboxylase family protein [Roseiconus lacunae]WRQ48615.1 carboxymuconolactone decarboxylase family protein [Stieleria sp. HD01]